MKGKTCIVVQLGKAVFQEFEYPGLHPFFDPSTNTVGLIDAAGEQVELLDLAKLRSVIFVPDNSGGN